MSAQPPGVRPAGHAEAGASCPSCRFPVKAGTAVAVCTACSLPHHADCWEERGGCAVPGCADTTATVQAPYAAPQWHAPPSAPPAPPPAPVRPRSNAPIVVAIVLLALVVAGAAGAVVITSGGGDDDARAATTDATATQDDGAQAARDDGAPAARLGSTAGSARRPAPSSASETAPATASAPKTDPSPTGTAAARAAAPSATVRAPATARRRPSDPLTTAERAQASGPTIYLAQLAALTVRAGADAEAARMTRLGVGAQVLRSDDFVGMLPGYWIVYAGFFDRKSVAVSAAATARRSGAAHAFTRAVARR